jgi:hypothetical protein
MRRSGVPLFDREIVTPEAVETTVPLPRRGRRAHRPCRGGAEGAQPV